MISLVHDMLLGLKFSMISWAAGEVNKMKMPSSGVYRAGNHDKSRVSLPAFTILPEIIFQKYYSRPNTLYYFTREVSQWVLLGIEKGR